MGPHYSNKHINENGRKYLYERTFYCDHNILFIKIVLQPVIDGKQLITLSTHKLACFISF